MKIFNLIKKLFEPTVTLVEQPEPQPAPPVQNITMPWGWRSTNGVAVIDSISGSYQMAPGDEFGAVNLYGTLEVPCGAKIRNICCLSNSRLIIHAGAKIGAICRSNCNQRIEYAD